MVKVEVELPRYTIALWRGGRWAFYFQVPKRLRPEGWPGSVRIRDDKGARITEAAKVIPIAEQLNAQLDRARSDTSKGPLPGTIPAVVRDYQHSEKYTLLSPRTKRSYDQCIARIEAWPKKNGNPHMRDMDRPEILRFLRTMNETPSMRDDVAARRSKPRWR